MKRMLVLSFRRERTLDTLRFSFSANSTSRIVPNRASSAGSPSAAILPTLRNAQRMALQLHRIPGSAQHPCHNGIGPFAEQFNFTAGPANALRHENRNVEGFPLCRHGARTAAQELCQFLIPDAANETEFVIGPSFSVRNI